MRTLRSLPVTLLALLCLAPSARAHVGSKDVFEQVSTGPYRLFVTIRPPTVIPGVAIIEIRTSGSPVRSISVTPVPITGEASKHPPTPDTMKRSTVDPAFYTGSLWLMSAGSWEVRFQVTGDAGAFATNIPVPAISLSILHMQRSMGTVLAIMGLLLILGMAGIVAAAVREARLSPSVSPAPDRRRRAVIAATLSLVLMGLAVWGGAAWWNVEAASYADIVYHPLSVRTVLTDSTLDLHVGTYASPRDIMHWHARSNDDFLPDHGHLMHLYAIRQPGMDAVFHLHPTLASAGDFRMALPTMPPGRYALYGDVVHANGFPETLTASVDVPSGLAPAALDPEDASASPPAISTADLPSSFKLPDGYTMAWKRPSQLTANTGYSFRFQLLDAADRPASDVRPYLGMAGHAAFVKRDGTTFAHTHPEGSAAMQAVMLANGDMSGMSSNAAADQEHIDPAVEFPYGFPSSGRYRIFVQMKHGATVETGVFDATVQ